LTAEPIREWLHLVPFQPFFLVLMDGRVLHIHHPDMLQVGPTYLNVSHDAKTSETLELDFVARLTPFESESYPVFRATTPTSPAAWRGLLEAAGAWADDDPEGLEQYLEWNRQQRKQNRPEIPE
jgi:hypothetical protein